MLYARIDSSDSVVPANLLQGRGNECGRGIHLEIHERLRWVATKKVDAEGDDFGDRIHDVCRESIC